MDNSNLAHSLFGYELASGALLALVVSGAISKSSATKLIGDCLEHAVQLHPSLRPELQEIAAKNTAQIEMVMIDFDRLRAKDAG